MGSEKYPFKGIIDQLANRGFSNGTNAWTDTDHTAYTVSTAGEQGFLQILPIYVDHILYPTLTQSGFVTEVKPSSFRPVSALPHSSTFRCIILMRRVMILESSIAKCKAGKILQATSLLCGSFNSAYSYGIQHIDLWPGHNRLSTPPEVLTEVRQVD